MSDDSVAVFVGTLETIQQDRHSFTTAEHRLGFSDAAIISGDQVVIFDGAISPYMIRRYEDEIDGEAYTLVAEAYIHGIMSAEVDDWAVERRGITLR